MARVDEGFERWKAQTGAIANFGKCLEQLIELYEAATNTEIPGLSVELETVEVDTPYGPGAFRSGVLKIGDIVYIMRLPKADT